MTAGLLLHSVDARPKPFNMSCWSKEKFGALLDRLIGGGTATLTVRQHLTAPADHGAQTVITFDDGLVSFYDNAYPLLLDKNVKSTIFPVVGLTGKSGGWDIMGQTRHMTAAMLREVAAAGHEVGSHSLTHANLVWLDDRELMKELRDSKLMLEDIIGDAVKSLSFPFGSWNRRVWDAAKSAGYEYATAYRGHRRVMPGMLPVLGVYRFDSVDDVVDRAQMKSPLSRGIALIMSHFSKGTPLVKFRKEYVRFPG
jgi:peptidoglycan/xylan/chitin deacetylase (PgdA/CDA1 family)